jgi:peptide/nickel transport system permease protein
MTRQFTQKLGQALLVLLAAFTVAFVLLQALPGDAVLIKFLGSEMGLTAEQIAELRIAYGADAPLWEQYLHALGNFLRGEFGYSIRSGVPVSQLLAENLPSTLWLALLALLAACLLALVLALLSQLEGFGWVRGFARSMPSLFVAVPVFWLGIMLIQVFSFQLGLVSVIAPEPWEELVLPVVTLAVPISAPLAQVLIRNIDAVFGEPFVAVARAKGARHQWVLWRHVFRNALPATLTMAGVLFGELLGGAVVTETVFGLGGLGGMTQQAVANQDVAVLQAIVVLSAFAFVAISLLVDLAMPLLDPRLALRPAGAP